MTHSNSVLHLRYTEYLEKPGEKKETQKMKGTPAEHLLSDSVKELRRSQREGKGDGDRERKRERMEERERGGVMFTE